MATVTITIPNNYVSRVNDALGSKYGYTGFEADGVTPLSKAEFGRRLIIQWIKDNVAEYEGRMAAAIAQDAVIADVRDNVNIT